LHVRRVVPAAALLLALAGCQSSSPLPSDATPAEIRAEADARAEAGDHEVALDLYERLADDHPDAPEARDAEWFAAEMAYEDDRLEAALKRYQSYYEDQPHRRRGEMERRVYDIGVRLYEEGSGGLFGLGILPTSEDGIRALTWLAESLDKGYLADDAWHFMASRRLESRNYEEAAIFFDELLQRYPQSEWALAARFGKAEAHLGRNRGPAYDRRALTKARAEFREYVRAVERDEERKAEYADRLAEAKERLAGIDRRLAEKNLLIARFYLGQERWRAARMYLEAARDEHPDSEAGREAEGLLRGLGGPDE